MKPVDDMDALKLHILVVEDDQVDFMLIQHMLNEIGDFNKEIIHAHTLEKAREEVKNKQFDLVLLDLALPDSSGKNTFDSLIKLLPDPPIIILSGLRDKKIELSIVNEGAQDFLVKGEFDDKLLVKSILHSIERKKGTIEKLKNLEAYRQIFENNPSPIIIWEKDNLQISEANQSFFDFSGYTRSELSGLNLSDLFNAEITQQSAENPDSFSEKTQSPQEVPCIKKDHSISSVEIFSRSFKYKGRDSCIFLIHDTGNQLNLTDDMVLHSRILEKIKDPIFVTDVNGHIIYWNSESEKLFEYNASDVSGKNYGLLYPEIDKVKVSEELIHILSGKLDTWLNKLISRNGRIIWVENKTSLIRDESNHIQSVVRVIRDISKNREFLNQQNENYNKLNAVFNNVEESIILLDKELNIKTFNLLSSRQFGQLMGLELRENKPILDYFPADMRNDLSVQLSEALQNKKISFEMPFRFSPQSVFWYNFHISSTVDEQGQPNGICLSMVNITERKQSDEKFHVQYQEVEKTNMELDRLVKILSHDLRAPMNSMTGLINLAKEEKDPAEFGTYLTMMEKSIKKLERFTNDVINSLRTRGNKEIKEVVLFEMTGELFNELKFSPNAKNINFQNIIPNDLIIKTDENLLRIILGNLLSNSIKYFDPLKEKPFVKISASVYESLVEIMVEDNGIGIATEHQGKVFETYYTINQSDENKGLGLANVKNAVEKLQGNIQLISEPGQGTKFIVSLPIS